MPNGVCRIQVRSQHRAKIGRNLKSKMDCLVASIFQRFGWTFEANRGSKTDQTSIKKTSKIDAKKKGAKMAKETLNVPAPPIEGAEPKPQRRGRGFQRMLAVDQYLTSVP